MAVTRVGFVVVTLFEFLTPLCLLSRKFRYVWLIIIIPFHFLTWLLMNIFFWQNLLLMLVLFVDISSYMTPKTLRNGIQPIIFFDGYCGLCNRFIDWIDARDYARVFHYAPLQGDAALRAGVQEDNPDTTQWTIVLRDEEGTWRRSDAALRIISRIGGIYGFASLLLYIPSPIRDAGYKLVARWRYRFFGKLQACHSVRGT